MLDDLERIPPTKPGMPQQSMCSSREAIPANYPNNKWIQPVKSVDVQMIHVYRGVNLAVRDIVSSDPYVVFRMGNQSIKTRVVKKNLNPEWNEELTLCVTDQRQPVQLMVYDRDTFGYDDKMGYAEFEIGPFLQAVKMRLHGLPNGTIVTRVLPSRQNYLAEESHIVWKDGKVVQNMVLWLRHVENGEIELQLQWIDIPGSTPQFD
ncbi:hypothetical protein SAY86_004999 [Trapa natans]|uniref:C2 domain-containing protein n=1 Tax=Trapa natans TaxID=22666 RepID=A0AAN7QSX6_TRANT|nr:hypothetical protein SAY86_004999 [Trapa natans]